MKIFLSLLLVCLLPVISLLAQTGSINNTLGTGGSFIVKDGANSYLRVDQSTGNSIFLRNLELGNLDNSISGIGVITKNNKRFMHNFAPNGSEFNNLFIGLEAGNFSMGGGTATFQSSNNLGVGSNSLKSLSTGYSNTAVGSASLYSNTIGYDNTALGYCPLFKNVGGNFNTAIGNYALFENLGGGVHAQDAVRPADRARRAGGGAHVRRLHQGHRGPAGRRRRLLRYDRVRFPKPLYIGDTVTVRYLT